MQKTATGTAVTCREQPSHGIQESRKPVLLIPRIPWLCRLAFEWLKPSPAVDNCVAITKRKVKKVVRKVKKATAKAARSAAKATKAKTKRAVKATRKDRKKLGKDLQTVAHDLVDVAGDALRS